MDVDLFGQKAARDGGRSALRTEVFDLAADLSQGERLLISSHLSDLAGRLNLTGEEKRANRLWHEADRYARCGEDALLLTCPDCRSKYFVPIRCRSRICEHCGRVYKRRLQDQIVPLIKETAANKRPGYVVALLTLTVTSQRFEGALPDRANIKRLYRETAEFFRLHYGKYHAHRSRSGKVVENRKRWIGAGWIAVLEVGKDNNNAHAHAIVYGPIRAWHGLRSSWERITGDSSGVDIRKVRSVKELTGYVLKYITKPPETESYTRIADYAVMIKGTRRLRAGGIFYNRISGQNRNRPECRCLFCRGRLVMDGESPLCHCQDRINLYAELRDIDRSLSTPGSPVLN